MNHGDGQYALSIDTGVTDVLLEAGRNDIEQFSISPAQVEASVQSIAARYASAGKRVWCFTVPPTTYSNDAWTSIANQSFPYAVDATGSSAIAAGATSLAMASVAGVSPGQSAGLNGTTNSPPQAIAPGTVVVSVNSATSSVTISPATAGALAAGTKIYFGMPQASASTIEMLRENYNAYVRANWQGTSGACTGLIDVDAIVADQAGSSKWRTDLGQASADGVHPSAVLHQAIVNSGVLNPSRFTAP